MEAANHASEDYTNWTNRDLIKRVTDLESQLRAQNIRHGVPLESIDPPKKKPKRPFKPFDPSKYSTRLIALKFAYLGGNYNGFEYHSNNTTPLPTIEEELWRALRKTKLIFPSFAPGQSEEEVCWNGCEYSKCGRTDRGVSAFGQVIGLRVRSAKAKKLGDAEQLWQDRSHGLGPNTDPQMNSGGDRPMLDANAGTEDIVETETGDWDSIRDEIPYIQILNRVLPPDIRILAWCPHPPSNFSARFSCRERRYRYFFTNPAYVQHPAVSREAQGNAWLNIPAMEQAAAKLQGMHDLRNFCKVDPSKQISNFERRIFSARIVPVSREHVPGAFLDSQSSTSSGDANEMESKLSVPHLYHFEVRGSAFLWHQVRHMVAILFLVGQGYEEPSIVDDLLDIHKTPGKPLYDMASDVPLVLWDCVFPESANQTESDHNPISSAVYDDALQWVYIGDEAGGQDTAKRSIPGLDDAEYGRNGILDDLWATWRRRKMDEVLAGSLMNVVAGRRKPSSISDLDCLKLGDLSARVFDGSDCPRNVGKYVPVMQRARTESPEVVNARYAARKGLGSSRSVNGEVDMEE